MWILVLVILLFISTKTNDVVLFLILDRKTPRTDFQNLFIIDFEVFLSLDEVDTLLLGSPNYDDGTSPFFVILSKLNLHLHDRSHFVVLWIS